MFWLVFLYGFLFFCCVLGLISFAFPLRFTSHRQYIRPSFLWRATVVAILIPMLPYIAIIPW